MKEGYGDGCKDTLFLMKEAMTDFTTPVRVLQSGQATIIFWKDDSKTVVKCQEGTKARLKRRRTCTTPSESWLPGR